MEEAKDISDIAIRFENIIFSYPGQEGTPALNNVSLSIRKGEFVSILGQNGSGKSTLARLCNGLLAPDEGKVYIFGMELEDDETVKKARKRVGIVFQNPDNQMVASIVEDDVAFGPENLGIEREEIGKRIAWALEAVGMTKYRYGTPTHLSGGQKQRIAVAGVLAILPDVIILDEATAMLDPKGRKEVIDVVTKLNREEGMTVILITHFMEEALKSDRAIVLNRGEIVMDGTPREIFDKGDMLKTFNLCRPVICDVRDALADMGMELSHTLDAETLSDEVVPYIKDKTLSLTKNEQPFFGGEWDINVEDLAYIYSSKSPFSTRALKDISLTIKEGEFYGVIGQTGSGKTTLIQHFNALLRLPSSLKKRKRPKAPKGQTLPDSKIRIGKYDLSSRKCDFKSLRADVGMVFQYPEYQLFADTVFSDVAFGLKNFKKDMTSQEIETAVREAVEIVGLDYNEVADKSPFDLSGGQKRRVAIAGVIVTKPKILILDEPAAGLDPLGKKEIMELLHKLHKEWCKTIVIVSHDMDEIAQNCTRAVVLSGGDIVLEGIPKDIFDHKDTLISLGLDVPLCAKLTFALRERGVDISCDYSFNGFVSAVENMYKSEGNYVK